MRILEIIQEYGETDIRVRKRKPNFDFRSMQDRTDRKQDSNSDVQPGWYSGGQTNPRDPHEFIKKPHLTSKMKNDGYFAYVKEINNLKQAGYSNPFFPQVYNVDITQDPKGNQRPRYRIEKLQSGFNFPEETLKGMYERLFYDDLDSHDYSGYSNPSAGIWDEIAHQVNRAVQDEDFSNIRDKKLVKALKVIHNILYDHPMWNVDLHGSNIRVRGSSTGPQLVLMDPISDGGASIPDSDDVLYGPDASAADREEQRRQQRPAARDDWSTFKNFAMGHATKKVSSDEQRKRDQFKVNMGGTTKPELQGRGKVVADLKAARERAKRIPDSEEQRFQKVLADLRLKDQERARDKERK